MAYWHLPKPYGAKYFFKGPERVNGHDKLVNLLNVFDKKAELKEKLLE